MLFGAILGPAVFGPLLAGRDLTGDALYQLLDRAPKARDEDNIPAGQWWWRGHDEYENNEGRTWPSG